VQRRANTKPHLRLPPSVEDGETRNNGTYPLMAWYERCLPVGSARRASDEFFTDLEEDCSRTSADGP
jgi:hypothetical protein